MISAPDSGAELLSHRTMSVGQEWKLRLIKTGPMLIQPDASRCTLDAGTTPWRVARIEVT